ncbi:MAG: hypothetical protein IJI22_04625 [Bacilli bacterium]|nr:hypothetical protein [Bacilli bacterium]
MNKERIIRYVEIVNQMERAIDKGENYKLSDDEKSFIREMQGEIANDEELRKQLEKIFALSPEERLEYINKNNDNDEKIEETDSVEEAIAKTFDIDVTSINHHFLQNGNEIFSFYSNLLGRNVVLESTSEGKSLIDVLKELQDGLENAEENNKGEDILLDESKRKNIEVKMYTKEEIVSNPVVFDFLDEDDEIKLNYLLDNYDSLQIEGIDTVNMIFIDKSGKIKEATLTKDKEVVIAEPLSESSSSSYEQDSSNKSKEETSELDSMFSNDEENITYEDEKLEEIRKDKEKAKVLVYQNEDGFINDVFYVFLAVLALVLTTFFIVSL